MGRKISIADLRKIHEEHKIWLNTIGEEGRCADLSEAKNKWCKTEPGQSE